MLLSVMDFNLYYIDGNTSIALNEKLNVDDWTQQELKDLIADFKSKNQPSQSLNISQFFFAEDVP